MYSLNPIQHARTVYSRERWEMLIQAHTQLLHGQARTGLQTFRKLLRGVTDLYGSHPVAWPPLADDFSQMSAVGGLILMRDFYHLIKTWMAWEWLANPVRELDAYPDMSPFMRAQMECGWVMTQSGMPVEQHIAYIESLLRTIAWDDTPMSRWTQLMLHITACELHNRGVDIHEAITHGETALELLDLAPHMPYCAVRVYEELGSAYYNAGTFSETRAAQLYDQALLFYDLADEIVEQIGPEAWPLGREYDKGWLFTKLGDLDEALTHFKRGAQRFSDTGLFFDAGRCYYGMGYTLLCQQNYDGARSSLQRALDLFTDKSHAQMNQDSFGVGWSTSRMLALVLQIMGLVEAETGNLELAKTYLEYSLGHMAGIDTPFVKYDTLQPLVEVCKRLGDSENLAEYEDELAMLQARYDLD